MTKLTLLGREGKKKKKKHRRGKIIKRTKLEKDEARRAEENSRQSD